MPESTCLHIQDRESGPIRVVELPWISVRIGRAAFCEVRLPDRELASEACRLTRRGRTWSLAPIGGEGSVQLEGRPVKSPCPLPFGVPFQIGSYCLTLRQDVGAEPDWEMYPAPAPPAFSTPSSPPRDPEERARHEHDRSATMTAPAPAPADAEARTTRDRARWEARWKAAEAHLRARSEGFQVGTEGRRGPYTAKYDPPSRERPAARPSAATSPRIDPAARPIPTSRAPRIEPGWTTPRTDPPAVAPRVEPSVRPAPAPSARREPARPGTPAQPPVPTVAPAPSWAEWSIPERPANTDLPPTDRGETATQDDPELDRPAEIVPQQPPAAMTETLGDPATILTADVIPQWSESVAPRASEADRELPGDPVGPGPERTSILETTEWTREDARALHDWVARESDIEVNTPPLHKGETRPGVPDSSVEDESLEVPPPSPSEDERDGRDEFDRPEAEPATSIDDPPQDEQLRGAKPILPSWEPIDPGSSRLPGREPKKRRVVRDRVGPERRAKLPRGTRPGERPSASEPRRDATPTTDEVIWPSVRDILSNRGTSLGPQPSVARARKSRQPLPTVPREPGQWLLPVRLAWPPVAVAVLFLGVGMSILSWIWAGDASSASVVTQRLLRPDPSPRRKSLPDWVVPPDGRWLTTTSQHMAHWGVYLAGAQADANRPAADVATILTRSVQISPLNPTARLALARLQPTAGGPATSPVSSLGLSRDAVSLAWSARRLLDAGKKEAAIRLYGRALAAASTGQVSRSVIPRFDEDESSRRFLLPGEDAVRDIVREMESRDWSFREWSRALPQNPTVLLATARLLREQHRSEADPLLASLIEGASPARPAESIEPRAVAARAEALALVSRLKEAEQEYRQAIEMADNDMIRRSWWFNLADIASRLNDETQRLVAIRAAGASIPSDEITKRASMLQRTADSRTRDRYGSRSAN